MDPGPKATVEHKKLTSAVLSGYRYFERHVDGFSFKRKDPVYNTYEGIYRTGDLPKVYRSWINTYRTQTIGKGKNHALTGRKIV